MSIALKSGTAASALNTIQPWKPSGARDQIKIVGSSTVFPFSTAVAEAYGRASRHRTPVVESTGSGGGLKLFCAGVGAEHPDITNASRRIKAKELKLCQENGVTDVIESVVGYDGIVVANAKDYSDFSLTRQQLFKALVRGPGKLTMWNEVDPSLPAIKIEVLGPPPLSGTRDAFEELALEKGCRFDVDSSSIAMCISIRSFLSSSSREARVSRNPPNKTETRSISRGSKPRVPLEHLSTLCSTVSRICFLPKVGVCEFEISDLKLTYINLSCVICNISALSPVENASIDIRECRFNWVPGPHFVRIITSRARSPPSFLLPHKQERSVD